MLIEAEFASRVLAVIKAGISQSAGRIVPWPSLVQAAKWHKALVTLKLEEDITISRNRRTPDSNPVKKLTIGGIRAGVVTSDFLANQNDGRAQWRARWTCPTKLRHYLQLGVYWMTNAQFQDAARHQIGCYRSSWHAFVDEIMIG